MRIELFSRLGLRGKRWYFRVRGANGEIIAASEGYHNRADCRATADKMRRELGKASIFCCGQPDA